METLEDRILCDAAPVVDPAQAEPQASIAIVMAPEAAEVSSIEAVPPSPQNQAMDSATQSRREVLFVDGSLPQAATLADSLQNSAPGGVELLVEILNPAQNGLEQIKDFLAANNTPGHSFDAIHLVTHGTEGQIKLGATHYHTGDFAAGQAGAAVVSEWKAFLGADADILLYGCDVAAGSSGVQLLQNLATASGAEVTASTNTTGSATRGADWVLEATTGAIETATLSSGLDVVLPAVPSVSLSLSNSTPFIGESFTITASFDNTDAAVTGYGPYIELFIDKTGADGVSPGSTALTEYDGVNIATSGAIKYLGANCVYTVLTLNSANPPLHPYQKDAAGNAVAIATPAGFSDGDQVFVIQLPFGSFTPDQPLGPVTIAATMSNKADVSTAMNISARGGFQYGNTALADYSTDASISGALVTTTVTPKLITLTKVYNGPEGETATGPNFPRSYTISVKVAPGQTVTNLIVTDTMEDNIQFKSVTAFSAGSTTSTPSLVNTGGQIVHNFGTVTGTGGTDASLTFDFFVPRQETDTFVAGVSDGVADVILNAMSGDDGSSVNNVSLTANWATPIDTRDVGTLISIDVAGAEAQFTPKSIAIQETAAIVTDTGNAGLSPADTVEHTLAIQISDYFAFQNLNLEQIISDAQHFDDSFLPTITVTEGGVTTATWNWNVANFSLSDNWTGAVAGAIGVNNVVHTLDAAANDGKAKISFNLSAEMITNGLDGRLLGRAIPNAGNGGVLDNYTVPATGTTVTIKYRTVIQELFTDDYTVNNPQVNQGDIITTSVTITGDLLNVSDAVTPTGQSEADTSGTTQNIIRSTINKSIFAINGSALGVVNEPPAAPSVEQQITPGDLVVYKLEYVLPTGNVDTLSITDYLPLPIYQVNDHNGDGTNGDAWAFNNVAPAALTSGQWCYGPGDTYSAYATANGGAASLPANVNNSDVVSNSLKWAFTNFNSPANTSLTIQIFFAVTANSKPFADGLFLTNQINSNEGTTNAGPQAENDIIQVVLKQPDLKIHKGVVATDNPNATFHYLGATKSVAALAATTINVENFTSPIEVGSTISFDNHEGAYTVSAVTNQTIDNKVVTTQVTISTVGGLYQAVPAGTAARVTVAAANVAPATFNAPDTAGSRFTGTISSDGLGTIRKDGVVPAGGKPIDANVDNLDQGDKVTFAIVIENVGQSTRGAFDVKFKDTLPAGLIVPTTGNLLNLRLTDGNGNLMTEGVHYQKVNAGDGANALFLSGYELLDPGLTAAGPGPTNSGAVDQYNATNANNIVVVTYDLQVDTLPVSRASYTNTATIFNYAGKEGGEDHTGTDGGVDETKKFTNTAVVRAAAPFAFSKTLVGTELTTNGNVASNQAVIGEKVTYSVVVRVPEGVTQNLVLTDIMDQGLTFVQFDSIVISAGVTSTTISNLATLTANNTISNNDVGTGNKIAINFGNVTNTDTDNAVAQTITIVYQAIVVNTNTAFTNTTPTAAPTAQVAAVTHTRGNQNTAGQDVLDNYVTLDFTNDPQTGAVQQFAQAADVLVVEPTVVLQGLTASPASGVAAGSVVTYTLTLQNGNAATDVTAYDLSLSSIMPSVFTAGTLTVTGVQVQNAAGGVGGTITVNGAATTPVANTDILFTGSTLAFAAGSNIDMETNTRLVITFTGTLNSTVVGGQNIVLGATTTWTSLNGAITDRTVNNAASDERTGATSTPNPTDPTAGGVVTATNNTDNSILDNYAATIERSLVAAAPALTKTIVTTSENYTTTVAGTERVAVGEIVRYRLVSTLIQGTSPDIHLVDLLPAGMLFINDGTARAAFVGDGTTSITSSTLGALTQVDEGVTPLASVVPAFVLPDTAISSARTSNTDAYASDTDVFFKLGNVINTELDADAEYLVLEFNVLVLNDNDTNTANGSTVQAGATLANSYEFRNDGSTTNTLVNTSAAVNVIVAEPNLTIATTVTAPAAATVDAGDTITYQIVVTNNSSGNDSAAAFDVRIVDALDAITATNQSLDLEYVSYVVTAKPAYSTLRTDTSSTATETLDVTFDRLNAGDSITITVNATVKSAAPAGAEIENTATATYTSLPAATGTLDAGTATTYGTSLNGLITSTIATAIAGTTGGLGAANYAATERGGSGVTTPTDNTPPSSATIVNNYAVGSSATAKLMGQPTIDKRFQNGSITADDTNVTSSSLADVVIGESVLMDILVTLPEGLTQSLVIEDFLPAGLRQDMTFNTVGYEIITTTAGSSLLTANFSNAAAVAAPTVTALSGTLGNADADVSYNFGNVTITDDNTANNNSFVIRMRLIAVNALANQVGTTLTDIAQLKFNDPDGAANAGPAATVTVADATNADHTVTVVEPTLAVTVATNVTPPIDAGDSYNHTITLSNTSGQTAYDVTLSAPIDSNYTVTAGVIAAGNITTTGGATVSAGAFEIVDLGAGAFTVRTVAGANVDIPTGGSVAITYSGTIVLTIPSGTNITQHANVRWTSTDGANADERGGAGVADTAPTTLVQTSTAAPLNNYALSNNVATLVNNTIQVAKTIVTTDFGGNDGLVTPGEIVTYRMTVTISEGVTGDLKIQDNIPVGMAYLPGTITLTVAGFNAYDTALGVGNAIIAPVPAATPGPTYTDGMDVIFDFASITVAADNVSTNNTFYFEYQAIVLDVASNDGILPGQTTLSNTATHNNGSGAVFATAGGTANVTVTEPNLTITNTLTIPTTPAVAGTVYTYIIIVQPTTNAVSGAYEVVIPNFAMSAELGTPVINSATITDGATTSNVAANFSLVGQNFSTVTPVNLLLNTNGTSDQRLIITITGTLASTVTQGVTIVQNADVNYTNYTGNRLAAGGYNPTADVTTDHERTYTANTTVNITTQGIGSLAGLVYADLNNNGVKDGTELPINNVTITLRGTDILGNTINRVMTTNATGAYSFTDLWEGNYTITETQPTGYTSGINKVGSQGGTVALDVITIATLTTGTNGINNNFGELLLGSLSGIVFEDSNNDGLKDGGELGIKNVVITLTGSDVTGATINRTTLTDSTGAYTFANLFQGTYTITETHPTAYISGINTVGSQGGSKLGDVISTITLTAGVNGINNNFGERLSTVENYFFDSFNNASSSGRDTPPDYYRYSSVENYRLAPITIAPIYSGESAPGATLVLEIFNTKGEVIGTQTVVSDAGGNWLATFPNSIVRDYPNSVRIAQQSASYSAFTDNGYNMRTYYASAIQTGHFFFEYLDVKSVMAKRASGAIDSLYEASLHTIGFGDTKHAYEHIGAQGTPSGY